MADAGEHEGARVDKWLWAARFFKTRALAAEAIDGGKIQVNGTRAKRAKVLHVGDRVRVRKGPYETMLTVREVSTRRGSATDAAKLYEETEESRAARERLIDQHRIAARATPDTKGRPTKKDRRQIHRFKERG